MKLEEIRPGQRIRLRHTIDRRDEDWHFDVTGTVEEVKLQKTESWFAHSKDDKFWLLRVKLRKDDGELSLINVDHRTQVDLLEDSATAS